MPLYIAKSGDWEGCHACLTDSLADSHLKDRATQLLIKYKSGALVTQFVVSGEYVTQRSNLALHRGDATRVTDLSLSGTLYSKLQSLSLSLCSEDVRGVKGA